MGADLGSFKLLFAVCCDMIEVGKNKDDSGGTAMKEYTIVRRADWAQVPVLKMENCLRPSPADVTAQAQLCYDDTALYVRLQAKEQNIRKEHTDPLAEICEDSCLEFFLCPMEGDDRYFNLEFNPNGNVYLGFGANLPTLHRLIPETQFIFPQVTFTNDGWAIEYAIPHEFVRIFFPGYSPAPGKTVRANCYKCGDLTEIPHWLCWNPVPEELHTFHCPDHFGLMHFA